MPAFSLETIAQNPALLARLGLDARYDNEGGAYRLFDAATGSRINDTTTLQSLLDLNNALDAQGRPRFGTSGYFSASANPYGYGSDPGNVDLNGKTYERRTGITYDELMNNPRYAQWAQEAGVTPSDFIYDDALGNLMEQNPRTGALFDRIDEKTKAENEANNWQSAFGQTIGLAMGLSGLAASGLGALAANGSELAASFVPSNYQSLWSSLAQHAAEAGGSFSDIASAFGGGTGVPGVGASDIPESYSRMLAEGGATMNDAAPAAAGTIPVNQFGMPDFSLPPGVPINPGTNMTGFMSPVTNPLLAGTTGAAGIASGLAGGVEGVSPYISGAASPSTWSLSSFLGNNPLQTLGLLTSGISGVTGALASKSAANTAADANNRATDAQLRMFDTINSQAAPYRQAGYSSLASMLGGMGLAAPSGGVGFGQFTHQFGPQDLKTNLAPNYQFMLDQGLGALTNKLNATGGIAGNTLKGINDYAMNYADNAYQSAFNNYNTNQTNIFNRLSNIAGLGQTANQTTANAGTSISGNAANTMVGAGNAQAAGTIGAANAVTGAANNALGWYALPYLLGTANNGRLNA